ncbi:MAG: hypothetical protein SGPRY_012660 [Prymnesium sp.]
MSHGLTPSSPAFSFPKLRRVATSALSLRGDSSLHLSGVAIVAPTVSAVRWIGVSATRTSARQQCACGGEEGGAGEGGEGRGVLQGGWGEGVDGTYTTRRPWEAKARSSLPLLLQMPTARAALSSDANQETAENFPTPAHHPKIGTGAQKPDKSAQ